MRIDIKNNGYRCKYCGGYVNPATMKCEYCDTQYEFPKLEVLTIKPGVQTLCTKMSVDNNLAQYYNKKEYDEFIKQRLAEGFLSFIKDNMKITETFDARSLTKSYYATMDFIIKE